MANLEYPYRKTIRLNAGNEFHLAQAKSLLEHGGIVALPTETVYGLAGNGLDSTAIRAIFHAKNRPLNNPLILHVHDVEQARLLFDFSWQAIIVKQRFERLAHTFWPGPLTIIANKPSQVPYEATAGLESVAIRVPDNLVSRTIMKGLAFPLVMPSANLSTRPSPTCADHVLATLDGRIDAVVDDGHCSVGIESTVVKINGDAVEIMRPGAIDGPQLEACLQEKVIEHKSSDDDAQPLSPGQTYLHYSPAVSSVRVCSPIDALARWNSDDTFLSRTSDFFDMEKVHGLRPLIATNILLDNEPRNYARQLYDALYQCERTPDKPLVIVLPMDHPSWKAVVDRLVRTAT